MYCCVCFDTIILRPTDINVLFFSYEKLKLCGLGHFDFSVTVSFLKVLIKLVEKLSGSPGQRTTPRDLPLWWLLPSEWDSTVKNLHWLKGVSILRIHQISLKIYFESFSQTDLQSNNSYFYPLLKIGQMPWAFNPLYSKNASKKMNVQYLLHLYVLASTKFHLMA